MVRQVYFRAQVTLPRSVDNKCNGSEDNTCIISWAEEDYNNGGGGGAHNKTV